jgi:hypothetical protein
LSARDERADDLLDRLMLEIKAVGLLYGSEAELRDVLESEVLKSNDESVRRFVKALQTPGASDTGRRLAIAAGELVMAAILVFAGALTLVPTIVGANTLASFIQYFAERTSGTIGSSPLSPYLSFLEFGTGVMLLLSAFFALREAALNLKRAGLSVRSGESR